MYQMTTPTTLPTSQRNAMVVEANMRCTANGCERQATRWSNLCGLCEKQWLEDHRPVWGKPTKEHLAAAEAVVRDRYRDDIGKGVFDIWSAQIGKTLARPLSLLVPPLAMRRYRYPRQRFTPLLALRTRDRGVLTRRGVISLLAFCLAVDTLITPLIPQPARKEYMLALLGQRFMGREVYSRIVSRYRSRREPTGVIRYGDDGPRELTRLVEEEVPTKEYFRIRRADLRYLGRQVWKVMEKTLLAGGRKGTDWKEMQDQVRQRLALANDHQGSWCLPSPWEVVHLLTK
jgi:hypothetical protein